MIWTIWRGMVTRSLPECQAKRLLLDPPQSMSSPASQLLSHNAIQPTMNEPSPHPLPNPITTRFATRRSKCSKSPTSVSSTRPVPLPAADKRLPAPPSRTAATPLDCSAPAAADSPCANSTMTRSPTLPPSARRRALPDWTSSPDAKRAPWVGSTERSPSVVTTRRISKNSIPMARQYRPTTKRPRRPGHRAIRWNASSWPSLADWIPLACLPRWTCFTPREKRPRAPEECIVPPAMPWMAPTRSTMITPKHHQLELDWAGFGCGFAARCGATVWN
mmetsp:Transcript_46006/g.96602  ORF Transcript_46006/g.96602 Transcript_46006/m.96602 type:complete len:276 (-) Transcript_46006:923-1750(-)